MLAELQRHAEEQPDSVAISDLTNRLTYREFVDRVAGLAAELVAHQEPGPAVLFVGHRVESAIAIFAAIWAGRWAVPLDPSEPNERLEALMARVRPAIVVDTVDGRSGAFADVPMIDGVIVRSGSVAPQPRDPDDICYLFFTSGSTGVPKGVPRTVEQSRRIVNASTPFGEGRIGVCLPLFFGGGFSATVHSLVHGQPVVLLDVRSMSPAQFAERVSNHALNRLILTPSLARLMGRSCRGMTGFKTVNDVFLVGEPVDWSDVADLRALGGPSATISVQMGATESLAVCFVMTITPDMPIGTGRVPLGRAPSPERIILEPTGDGTITQLVLRGDTITSYFDRNERAAEMFSVDSDGVSLWRSGDLVELAPDGEYYHRGRIDDMVKLNGRLVEPAEVEAALAAFPEITSSVVLPRTLSSGRKVLIAHIAAPADYDLAAVRRLLRRSLPSSLVPAHLIRHDVLPLTGRGKVDRRELADFPLPTLQPTEQLKVIDPLEFAVTGVVASLLEVPHVGPDDDIWDLGCDSFAAVQISSALCDELASTLHPNDLLHARSVRQLCDRIRTGVQRERSHVVTMNDNGHLPPIFLVSGAGSPALSFYPLAAALTAEQPLVIYEQYGLHQAAEPDTTVAAAAERHVQDLRQRLPSGPCILAGYSMGGQVAHAMAALLHAEGRDVRVISLDGSLQRHLPRRPLRALRRARALARASRREGGLLRAVRSRLPGPAIGTTARYDLFYRHGVRAHATYTPRSLGIPVLLVAPTTSKSDRTWQTEHRLHVVRVSGDHFSMLHPPHIDEVAAAIQAFTASQRLP